MRFRVLVFGISLLTHVPASAATIGTFSWVYDVAFGTGSTFSVTNETGDPFSAVFVDLYAPELASPMESLELGAIAGGGIAQNFETLPYLVPSELALAHLRLTYLGSEFAFDLLATGLTGDPDDFLAGSIDILTPDVPPPAPVPEPSSLALIGIAGAALALSRLWHRQVAARSGTINPADGK